MALNALDTDVEADCCTDSSGTDLDLPPAGFGTSAMMGVTPRQPRLNSSLQSFGIVPRETRHKQSVRTHLPNQTVATSGPVHSYIQATEDISDDMIEDGAHVVFDWDNTLKLYNRETHQLSCRVSRQFLLHLKNDRHCQLYIISAIRPSALNLTTLLSEVDKLGLTDVFIRDSADQLDGMAADKAVVKAGEYAHMGNIIICGYDKAETFLKLARFNSNRGDKVMFFDDEEVNIHNFSALVPNSRCYLCK